MAQIIYDTLSNLALNQIKHLTIVELHKTIIATPLQHPAYLTVLAYYHPAAIVKPDQAELAAQLTTQGIKLELPRKTITVIQAKVVELLLAGLSTEAIATKLGNTRKTVAAHVSMVLQEYGLGTRQELIAKIYQSGGEN